MHHGGQLQFGPDGLLYVSTGMGNEAAVSQDPNRPGGKILRLRPVPARCRRSSRSACATRGASRSTAARC